MSPIAIPATGAFTGTPASIKARLPAHTVAIEEEPFDSVISETIRIVYANSSGDGSIFSSALVARAPCPISLRPGPIIRLASPTQ